MNLDWNISHKDAAGMTTGAISVNVPSQTALLSDIDQRLDQKDGFSIATLNLDHVVKIKHDPTFRQAYAAHSHITADGNPIVWLQKLAGFPVTLTPGSELVDPVAALATQKGIPVGLFGATETSLQGAAEAMQQKHAGLNVVSQIAPPMGFDPSSNEAGRLIDELAASGARIVYLALGAPKQEKLAARIAATHPDIGTLSIGAGLDFVSGAQTRAPAWARRIAMEWLWRLLQNPARLWKRYRDCFVVLPSLTTLALKTRLRNGATAG